MLMAVATHLSSTDIPKNNFSWARLVRGGELMTSNIGQYNVDPPILVAEYQRALRLDVASRLIITQEKRSTYSASCVNLNIAAAGTDFFTMTGSDTKTIIVKRIRFSGASSNTTQSNIGLMKRTTANSGGAYTTLANVPHDSANPVATATVRAYTSNPTLGTLVGALRWVDYTSLSVNSNSVTDLREFQFGTEEDQGIVLRGSNEVLALNFNGQTVTFSASTGYDLSFEWREITGG
jgi:hypothetical protein